MTKPTTVGSLNLKVGDEFYYITMDLATNTTEIVKLRHLYFGGAGRQKYTVSEGTGHHANLLWYLSIGFPAFTNYWDALDYRLHQRQWN